MAALPALGAVINFGVGYDTTDVDAAAAAGIGVSNTPDVLTDCVADTAVGLLIDVLRRFTDADRYLRAGRWTVDGNYPLTRQVSNTRMCMARPWASSAWAGSAAQLPSGSALSAAPSAITTAIGCPIRRTATPRRRWSWPAMSTCWWWPRPAATEPAAW